MITFVEDISKGYKNRTYSNAMLADATLAFALNFETSGEKMTKKATLDSEKVYIPIELSYDYINANIDKIAKILIDSDCHKLNIAGNGMSRLINFSMTQKMCDAIVLYTISKLIDLGVVIDSIRSGGQTGADESGLKAAEQLNIDSICLAPLGWRFRTETCDISDETLFKSRFLK